MTAMVNFSFHPAYLKMEMVEIIDGHVVLGVKNNDGCEGRVLLMFFFGAAEKLIRIETLTSLHIYGPWPLG